MRLMGGSETILQANMRMFNWDGYSNIASTAATLSDNVISAWSLNIFGNRKSFKIGASTFFPDQEEGSIVRIFDFDMNQLVFRNMVSEWLSPDDYKWEYKVVCKNDSD